MVSVLPLGYRRVTPPDVRFRAFPLPWCMTSDQNSKVKRPGSSAAVRRSPADAARAWGGLLLAAVPTAAVLTLLLYGLGLAMGFGVPGILAIVWLLICVVAAVAGFLGAERRWLSLRFGVRPPTDDERPRLAAAWTRVAGRAGVPASSYSLWVRTADRDFALPDRMIAVTPASLGLPPAELEAVLAQVLGRRVRGRTALCQFIFRNYNLPLVWLERVFLSGPVAAGSWISRQLAPRAGRIFGVGWTAISRVLVACPVIAASTVLVGLPAAVLLRLAPEVAACALVPIVRRIEYRADRTAVELGYGADLGVVLRDRHLSTTEPTALYALSVSAYAPEISAEERVRHIRDGLDELARAGRIAGPGRP